MSLENVSLQMQKKFEILDEMIAKGYIEPVKPLFSWLPTLCHYPNKTSNFHNAPQELKYQFNFMFSWYAFFLGIFAFTQIRLEKDFLIYLSIFTGIFSLIPPTQFDRVIEIGTSFYFSQIFVFSYYYQYQTYGRCASKRNIFQTICISLIYLFLIVIGSEIIQTILYHDIKRLFIK
ncbi:hypothetical protein [Anabaena azotica]|uniref:Uncharacterized protein n=1 Tax=Anabaena azotica FACHB-119 TaxID=947527 RepID=A0ABR8DF93_9NOST|nr:hypothetical protein [Anabaena azotica]MBD2504877.1 hypothetical protein [Anabaena azotica FACHB-119]